MNCKICNYSTKRKHNFQKHLESKKHQNYVKIKLFYEKEYEIKMEQIEKIIKKKYENKMKSTEIFYKNKIEKLINEYELKLKDKELEMTKKSDKFKTEMVKTLSENNKSNIRITEKIQENTKELTKGTMSALKFIQENFKNAPSIKTIETKINEDDIKKIEKMTNLNKMKYLVSKMYLMNKADKERSLWCTDINRIKYIIKLEDTWESDPKGIKVMKEFVPKMTDYLMKLTRNYSSDLSMSKKEINRNQKILKFLTEIILNLEDYTSKAIKNRDLAKKFHLKGCKKQNCQYQVDGKLY